MIGHMARLDRVYILCYDDIPWRGLLPIHVGTGYSWRTSLWYHVFAGNGRSQPLFPSEERCCTWNNCYWLFAGRSNLPNRTGQNVQERVLRLRLVGADHWVYHVSDVVLVVGYGSTTSTSTKRQNLDAFCFQASRLLLVSGWDVSNDLGRVYTVLLSDGICYRTGNERQLVLLHSFYSQR